MAFNSIVLAFKSLKPLEKLSFKENSRTNLLMMVSFSVFVDLQRRYDKSMQTHQGIPSLNSLLIRYSSPLHPNPNRFLNLVRSFSDELQKLSKNCHLFILDSTIITSTSQTHTLYFLSTNKCISIPMFSEIPSASHTCNSFCSC